MDKNIESIDSDIPTLIFFENDALAEQNVAKHMLEIGLISQEEFDNLRKN